MSPPLPEAVTSNPSFQRQVIKVVCLHCELVILVRHTCSRLRQKNRLYNIPSLCGGGMISIKQLGYKRLRTPFLLCSRIVNIFLALFSSLNFEI